MIFGAPGVGRLSKRVGAAYWERSISVGLGGAEALADPGQDRAIA
jgi:hypothetical protein